MHFPFGLEHPRGVGCLYSICPEVAFLSPSLLCLALEGLRSGQTDTEQTAQTNPGGKKNSGIAADETNVGEFPVLSLPL